MISRISRATRNFSILAAFLALGSGTWLFGTQEKAPQSARTFVAMVSRKSLNPLIFQLAANGVRPGDPMEDVRVRLDKIGTRDCLELSREKCVLWFHDGPHVYGLGDDETSTSWILVEGTPDRVRSVTFRTIY